SRLQAGCVDREGRDFSRALPEICANVSSYPAGRRRGHYGRGTTFSRAVRAPLSFCHSEELQFRGICFGLLLIRKFSRAFLAGSRPLGTMREEDLSARVKLVPFPKSARM